MLIYKMFSNTNTSWVNKNGSNLYWQAIKNNNLLAFKLPHNIGLLSKFLTTKDSGNELDSAVSIDDKDNKLSTTSEWFAESSCHLLPSRF